MIDSHQRPLSPPEIARMWGVSARKVRAWIRSGQLPAVNVAERTEGRPRYAVSANDLTRFMQLRMFQYGNIQQGNMQSTI